MSVNHEDVALAVARELRVIAQQIEATHSAQQTGECWQGLDGKVYLPGSGRVCTRCGILKTGGHMCGSCGENV